MGWGGIVGVPTIELQALYYYASYNVRQTLVR